MDKNKKQPFPKIYANEKEDYELFESEESQLEALSVETGIKF